jgi:iron complex outermembrane recepter protein
MRHGNRALALWFFSVTGAACLTHRAEAQTGASGSDTPPVDSGTQLEEIFVTAQKRSESLEQTPISITAITGDTLQQQGVTNLTAIIQQTPGISFRSYGPGQTEIEMRGLTSSGGQSPTVGFYLDETPMTAPAGAQNGKVVVDPDLFDLARVEVLRGPQGTLYGSGSMGGTVRLITNAPDLTEFVAKAEAVGSNTEGGGWNHAENGALNFVIIPDKLAVRLVASNSYTDGWISRIVENPFPLETNPSCPGFYGCTRGNVLGGHVVADYPHSNDADRTSARAALLFKPFDELSIDLTYMNQKIATGGYSLFDSVPGTDAHYQPFDVPEPTSDTLDLFSALIKYRLGDFEITSATARWYRRESLNQDASEVVQNLFLVPAFNPPEGGGPSLIVEADRTDQTSEEFRIASVGSGPLQGVVGTFLSRFNSNTYIGWFAPGFQPLFGTGLLTYYFQPTHVDQRAAFGEGTYQLTPELKLTAGLRWFSYSNTISTTQYGLANGGPIPTVNSAGAAATGYNPKLNLAYEPNDNTLVYMTVAKGFRPGAGNFAVPLEGADSCVAALAKLGLTHAPAEFKPDILWSYEIGDKLQFFDRKLTINDAIYWESWQGVQQQVSLSCGFVFTANAGNAAVKGGEIEIAARPTPELTFTANGGYTKAALVADTPSTGGLAGAQLQNVPKATASGSAEYSTPIGRNFTFDGRISDDYVGRRVDYLGPLPSYSLAKLRLGVLKDEWSAYFFVDNLTNKMVYLSNATSLSVNLPTYNRAATELPRTFGIDLNYKFGGPRP